MDSEILGYVVYVTTKITAYASWCYLGVRLFDPARTQLAGIAAIYGFARFLLGLVAGIGIFLAALEMNNATRIADVPLGILEGGVVPVGRPFC